MEPDLSHESQNKISCFAGKQVASEKSLQDYFEKIKKIFDRDERPAIIDPYENIKLEFDFDSDMKKKNKTSELLNIQPIQQQSSIQKI